MNNVVHYSLFDTAVNGWLIGQGALDIHGGDQIGLVVETGCRYFSEMAFPDMVTAGLRVARLGSSSVRYEVGLFRNDDETAAAEGFFVHVYVERATRRPRELNAKLREVLEAILS
jgi:acyl-CoA thioester hydrolase